MAGEEQLSQAAVRVWFSFDPHGVRVDRFQPLVKTVQGSEPLDQQWEGVKSGAWVEVQDAEGRPLWRRGLVNPFGLRVETSQPDGRFKGGFLELDRGRFQVIVPQPRSAHEVVLFSSPRDRRRRRFGPARALAAFELPRRR